MHVEKIGFEANPKHTVGYRLVVYHGSGWSRHAWTCASGTADRSWAPDAAHELAGGSFTQAIAALFLFLQHGVWPHLSGAGIRDAGAISGLECTALLAVGPQVRMDGEIDGARHAQPAWQVRSVR